MRRGLQWLGRVLIGLAVLVVVAYGVVYIASERILNRTYPVASATLSVPADRAAVAEGRRLAAVHGCAPGCHGAQAEGAVMFDDPVLARIVAPDLTAAVRRYDAAQLSTIVRHGVRPDGRSLLVMPAEAYVPMTDADLGRIIAYLRSLPVAHGRGPEIGVGPIGRIGLTTGRFKTAARLLEERTEPPEVPAGNESEGRYLAWTACGHCHGSALRGNATPSFVAPDLAVVAAYSPEAFAALLRTGTALGGRELGVMSRWARSNLSQLTDDEIAALYRYLHALGTVAR